MHDYQGIIPKLGIFEREGIGFPIQNDFFLLKEEAFTHYFFALHIIFLFYLNTFFQKHKSGCKYLKQCCTIEKFFHGF